MNKNNFYIKILKTFLFAIAIIFLLLLSYGQFFTFPTVFIILTTKLFYHQNWKKYLGIDLSVKFVSYLISLCLLISILSHIIVYLIFSFEYKIKINTLHSYIFTFLQSINEELVFRGLLISLLLVFGKKKWQIILFGAIVFSLLHYYVYLYLFSNQGVIKLKALITIAIFSISLNIIFIFTRSILLPTALHFGWNSTRFASDLISKNTKKEIPEFAKFNLMEGSTFIFMFSFILLCFTIIYFIKLKKR